jgi:hypothetical protein
MSRLRLVVTHQEPNGLLAEQDLITDKSEYDFHPARFHFLHTYDIITRRLVELGCVGDFPWLATYEDLVHGKTKNV